MGDRGTGRRSRERGFERYRAHARDSGNGGPMSGVKRLRLQERLIDPRSPDRSPRRAAYALPTLFTAGNVFLGFYSIMEAFRGAILNAQVGAQASAAAN